MVHYVHTGKALRVRRGTYRLVHFPRGEHEELVAAWLWSEPSWRDLAPDRARPPRALGRAPGAHASEPFQATGGAAASGCRPMSCSTTRMSRRGSHLFGAVPTTNPRRSLNDCAREGMSPELLRQAAQQALRRGLVTKVELVKVEEALKAIWRTRRMTVQTYPSPESFKQALEQRLRTSAKTGADSRASGSSSCSIASSRASSPCWAIPQWSRAASRSSFASSAPARRRTSICEWWAHPTTSSRSCRKRSPRPRRLHDL